MSAFGQARASAMRNLIGARGAKRAAGSARHSALEGHTGHVAKPRSAMRVRKTRLRKPRLRG